MLHRWRCRARGGIWQGFLRWAVWAALSIWACNALGCVCNRQYTDDAEYHYCNIAACRSLDARLKWL